MTNTNLENLPPELQARIQAIIAGSGQEQQAVPQQPAKPALVQQRQSFDQAVTQRQPTLMDHTVALRQEVAALRQELNAVAQVTEAVGSAVGQLYNTFLGQSQATDYGSSYQAQDEQADY